MFRVSFEFGSTSNAAILQALKELKMTVDEAVAKLTGLSNTVTKIGEETAKSLQMITDLKKQIEDAGSTVPTAIVDGINALEEQLKKVDDQVPDEPTA